MNAPPSKRLLIVDDDDSLRQIFVITMEAAGYQVAGAEDGILGIAKVKAFRPHLIVLDLMMPRLNGFDVLRRLQDEGHGSIPVVVVTGFSESANEQLVRHEPNVVAFMPKPIKYAELTALIGRLLAD